MESSAFSFQLKIKSCLLRETGTNNGGALKGFVKFNKYYKNIGHISTVLCLASSNGGFRKEIHGWALSEFVKLHKNYNNNRNIPTRLCLAGLRQETEGIGSNDGVIIVDHGSRRKESNLMLNEFVVMFRDITGYPIVEPAHMDKLFRISDCYSSIDMQPRKQGFFSYPHPHDLVYRILRKYRSMFIMLHYFTRITRSWQNHPLKMLLLHVFDKGSIV